MPRYSSKYRSSRRRMVKKPKRQPQRIEGVSKQGRTPKIYVPQVGRNRMTGLNVMNNAFPLPAFYDTTHRYVLNNLFANQTSGLVGLDFYIKLNNLYTPSVGSGAHQPYGYDQMKSFYVLNRVFKVDINVRIIYSTNRSNCLCLYWKRDQNNLTINGLSPDVVQELSNTVVLSPGTGDMEFQNFDISLNIADVAGEDPKTIMQDDIFAQRSNLDVDPTGACSMGVACGDWNLNGDQTVRAVITMTYHTRWSLLANPGPS